MKNFQYPLCFEILLLGFEFNAPVTAKERLSRLISDSLALHLNLPLKMWG